LCFLWASTSSAQWNQNATTIHTNLSVGINQAQAESYLHIFEQPPFLGGPTPIGLIRLQSTDVNMNPVPNFYWDFRMDYSPNLTFWQKTNGNSSVAALELSSASVKVFEKLKVGSNAEYAAGLTPDNTQGYFLSLGMKELSSGVWQGNGTAIFATNSGEFQLVTNQSGSIVNGASAMLSNVRLTADDNGIGVNGSFRLNTTNDFGYDMAVNGDAIFNKVVVKAYGTWPDFVFSKSYNLLSLAEVDMFIKTNGHLPNVPTAYEVEQNGVDIYEMNKTLLQKVEELTLYLIQLEKELKALKNEH
jgi:hypothetical protein